MTLIGFIIQVFLSYVYIPKSSLEFERKQGL